MAKINRSENTALEYFESSVGRGYVVRIPIAWHSADITKSEWPEIRKSLLANALDIINDAIDESEEMMQDMLAYEQEEELRAQEHEERRKWEEAEWERLYGHQS